MYYIWCISSVFLSRKTFFPHTFEQTIQSRLNVTHSGKWLLELSSLRSCLCSKVRGRPPWDLLLVRTSLRSTTLRSPAGTHKLEVDHPRSPAGTHKLYRLRSCLCSKVRGWPPWDLLSCWYPQARGRPPWDLLLVPTSSRSTTLRSPAGTHKFYRLRSCLCSKVRGRPPWDLLLVPTSLRSTTLRSPAGTHKLKIDTPWSPAGTHKLEVDHPEISCWYPQALLS